MYTFIFKNRKTDRFDIRRIQNFHILDEKAEENYHWFQNLPERWKIYYLHKLLKQIFLWRNGSAPPLPAASEASAGIFRNIFPSNL